MKNRKYILAIITLTAISLANPLLSSPDCHDHGAAPSINQANTSGRVQITKDTLANIKIEKTTVIKHSIDKVVKALGKIENIPENTFKISSRINGKVKEVYVQLADKVKKGDNLCKIESLLAGDPPPNIILKAPADGIVESLDIVNGAAIEANSNLSSIVNTEQIYAVANVFEEDFHKLKVGQIAKVNIPALGNKTYKAKLVKFAPNANIQTNTIKAYFQIDNPNSELKNNMKAFFNIIIDTFNENICIPNEAIAGDFPLQYVFVEECSQDLIYKKTAIKVGYKDDKSTQILSGLEVGDIVISKGVYQMQFLPSALDEHSHEEVAEDSHDHNAPSAITHSHSHEQEDSIQEGISEYIQKTREYLSQLPQNKYFNSVIYIGLIISLLLNIIFVISGFFKPKN